MKEIITDDRSSDDLLESAGPEQRENVWCEKFGYFIDLAACEARSLNRPVCCRCYKSLIQLSLPFGKS